MISPRTCNAAAGRQRATETRLLRVGAPPNVHGRRHSITAYQGPANFDVDVPRHLPAAQMISVFRKELCALWTCGVFLEGTILASLRFLGHWRVSLVSFIMKSAGCCPTCESAGQTGSAGGKTSHYVQSPGTWRQPRAINTVKAG